MFSTSCSLNRLLRHPWVGVVSLDIVSPSPIGHSNNIYETHPLINPRQHHAHAEPHALIVVHHVSHELAGSGHRDALSVAQLVQPTLLGEDAVPVHAVSCTARQCTWVKR